VSNNSSNTDLDFLNSLVNPEKLIYLNLSCNEISRQDLSFLNKLKGLESINLHSNYFYGSLEPLKNLTKLRYLDISYTDVDQGLEYLPKSLKTIYCESKKQWPDDKRNPACGKISKELQDYHLSVDNVKPGWYSSHVQEYNYQA